MKIFALVCASLLCFASVHATDNTACPGCNKCSITCECGCKTTGVCNCPANTCGTGQSCAADCKCVETGQCLCDPKVCKCSCNQSANK